MKGTYLAIAALIGILILAAGGSYIQWTTLSTPMPTAGWVALWGGVIFSIVLGIVLMTLMFYSSRRGWDDEAQNTGFEDVSDPDEQRTTGEFDRR
jgi:hypothetical protein